MLTIGQLARQVGVSIKTIRVYHDKGLLPEPRRDASGYRRYTARDAIELVKVRTLAEAGVPLGRITALTGAGPEEFGRILSEIDRELTARIRGLRATQRRLRDLDAGHRRLLPSAVVEHLESLAGLGFTARWVAMEIDLWILVFATHPDTATELFRDQADALTDPDLRQLYLDYDRAHDLDPGDPEIDAVAGRIIDASRLRYGPGRPPGQDVASEVPALMQAAINAGSPAWERLDSLLRQALLG